MDFIKISMIVILLTTFIEFDLIRPKQSDHHYFHSTDLFRVYNIQLIILIFKFAYSIL